MRSIAVRSSMVFTAMGVALLAICQSDVAADEPSLPLPSIPQNSFNISNYGSVPDGVTLNTVAITKAIDACEKAGGGTVEIPPGRFLTAALRLGSNLNFHLNDGAVLLFSNNFDDYRLESHGGYPNLLIADNCHDVAITGNGTIDGQGRPWWTEYLKTKGASADVPHMAHRPYMVVLKDCKRVLIQGITLTNSPSFHLVPGSCTDVTIDHVSIVAPADSPNTDALDPSGWNFLITHCTFDVGDDCIAIKAGGKPLGGKASCENFLVADCTFKHGHGMSIGGQSSGGLRHLLVRDCTFDGTGAGIRMKANRGAGGLVEDCTYENLTMKNVKFPIYITSYYPESGTPKSAAADAVYVVNATTPIWRDIHIMNVISTGSPSAGRIIGLAEMPIFNVELDNVKITAQKGLDIWNVKNLQFVNSRITVAGSMALNVQQSSGIRGLNPRSGQPE
jgi:polygalacturonase